MEEVNLIRAGALARPLHALRSQVGPRARPFEDMRLLGDQLSNPETRVDADTYLEAIDRCTYLAGDSHFMLRNGIDLSIQELGLLGQAMLSSRTLWDTLLTKKEFARYFQSGSGLDISIRKGRCRVRYIHGLDAAGKWAQDIQYTIGMLANIVCRPQHGIDPEIILFYPDAKSSQLKDLPTSTKVVSSTVGIIEFDERAIRSPMPQGNSVRSEILKRFMDSNTIDTAIDLSMTETVVQLLRASTGVTRPSQPKIAAILGMNVRALQRALQVEQTTFRQILERTRLAIALDDLAEGKSVTETAMKLGYDHPQNFTTAFKSWTE